MDILVCKGTNLKEKEKMKSRLNNERGFTLIELVMVIVILGILAAVAIPRFVDLQGSARTSTINAVGGALAGQITMLHAKKLINSITYDVATVMGSIDSSGFTITNASNVITATLNDGASYTWSYTDNDGASASGFAAATIAGPNVQP